MKKILSFILIAATLLSLASCKKPKTETPEWMLETESETIVDFKSEVPEMSVSEAKSYLESEDADQSSAKYRRAVYTVNETVATTAVEEAFAAKKKTERVIELFEKIDFRYLDGEALQSPEIKNRLSKLGTISKDADGNYQFTFHDRTLAQSAAYVKSDHALGAYTQVLELLLEDPNVTMDPLE